jgi:hypothetical protein
LTLLHPIWMCRATYGAPAELLWLTIRWEKTWKLIRGLLEACSQLIMCRFHMVNIMPFGIRKMVRE